MGGTRAANLTARNQNLTLWDEDPALSRSCPIGLGQNFDGLAGQGRIFRKIPLTGKNHEILIFTNILLRVD